MFKRKVQKQAEKQIEMHMNDLKLYLENNYKDLAIAARKDAISLVEASYERREIDEKTYMKYQKILSEYTQKMENYNHQQFYRT